MLDAAVQHVPRTKGTGPHEVDDGLSSIRSPIPSSRTLFRYAQAGVDIQDIEAVLQHAELLRHRGSGDGALSRRALARVFGVSPSTVKKGVLRAEEAGLMTPGKPRFDPNDVPIIMAHILTLRARPAPAAEG